MEVIVIIIQSFNINNQSDYPPSLLLTLVGEIDNVSKIKIERPLLITNKFRSFK